jgi:peroxiredoxin
VAGFSLSASFFFFGVLIMLNIGSTIPFVTLYEFIDEDTPGCSLGPNAVDVKAATAGKTVVIFALPGAYTPTCSAQHLPGYVALADQFKAAGVDEVWCLAVNDAFVMGAWGREHQAAGRVRMMADGSADFTRATGLTLDLSTKGLGLRSQRYSMLVRDGVVQTLNVEAPGAFEVSNAETILAQAQIANRQA